jgi:predicted lipid carrier protein YhbT
MNLADLAVPAPVGALLRRLPEAPPSLAVALALNVALAARLLERSSFEALAGKRLRIEASDTGTGVTLTMGGGRFAAARGPADVVIRARVADYVLLALRREDPDTLFFTRRLVIEGDTDLGLIVKNALDALDWDRLPAPLRALLRASVR